MSLIYDRKDELIDWAQQRIGIRFRDDARAIGLEGSDGIKAVVVYDTFSQCDCCMHIASNGTKRWLTRSLVYAAFAFPFVQCGFRRVTGIVPLKNQEALTFDQKLGFKYEGLCQHALPDDDVVILGMLRKDCAFIPKEYRHD